MKILMLKTKIWLYERKKILVALSEFDKGELDKVKIIHKKTSLIPDEINEAIRNLARSLLINVANPLENLPPYKFYAVEITDFGRQILEQFV